MVFKTQGEKEAFKAGMRKQFNISHPKKNYHVVSVEHQFDSKGNFLGNRYRRLESFSNINQAKSKVLYNTKTYTSSDIKDAKEILSKKNNTNGVGVVSYHLVTEDYRSGIGFKDKSINDFNIGKGKIKTPNFTKLFKS